MSILDTFYILFKSDSTDAEKGLNRINTQLTGVESSLGRVARRWLSLYALINSTQHAFGYAFDLTVASQSLGVNSAALEAWGGAVVKTGGTLKGFEASLQSLAEHLGTTPKIALEVLPKLADQFQKLNQFQAQKYGKILGLDTPTILLLQQGRREIDSLITRQKELGVVTKQDALVFGTFRTELENTGHGMRSLFYQIALAVIPTINKVLHSFQDATIYLRKHSGFVKAALLTIGAAGLIAVAPFVLLNSSAILATVGVLALAAAVGLAWDDIQTYLKGGSSLTGDLLKEFPELEKAIKSTFHALSWGANMALGDLGKLLEKIGLLKSLFLTFSLKNIAIQGIADSIRESNAEAVGRGQQAVQLATSSAISLQPSSIIHNRNANREVNLSINEIIINTQADNPRDIAYGLDVALQKQFRQALNDVSGGVAI